MDVLKITECSVVGASVSTSCGSVGLISVYPPIAGTLELEAGRCADNFGL